MDGFETSTTKICRQIREWILAGQLSPGAPLIRRTLSKQLGVSPIPVTEALLLLGEEGLVETVPMFGSRVAPITLEAVRNDQMLREALECEVARLCAEKGGGFENAQALAQELDAAMRASPSPADRLAVDSGGEAQRVREHMNLHMDFHLALARASGYPLLERELRKVWVRRLRCLNWVNAALHPVPADWHGQLLMAIASGDPLRADAAARAHVRYGQEHDLQVVRLLENRRRNPGASAKGRSDESAEAVGD